jgi:hypothetical protein
MADSGRSESAGGGTSGVQTRGVVNSPERDKAAMGASAAEREAERRRKKAVAARNRYWSKKGTPPPPVDARTLRHSPAAAAPVKKDDERQEEDVDDSDELDELLDGLEDAPKSEPVKEGQKARASRMKAAGAARRPAPAKERHREKKEAGISFNKLLIGGALIAAGLWLNSGQGASATRVPQGAPTSRSEGGIALGAEQPLATTGALLPFEVQNGGGRT